MRALYAWLAKLDANTDVQQAAFYGSAGGVGCNEDNKKETAPIENCELQKNVRFDTDDVVLGRVKP